jgi:glycosyltransferase involved in cell wall biosynthesis
MLWLVSTIVEQFTRDELPPFIGYPVLRANGRWILHAPNGQLPFAGRIRYWGPTRELAFTPRRSSRNFSGLHRRREWRCLKRSDLFPEYDCGCDKVTPQMRVLLIGNYANDRQESMQRFAEMMHRGLTAAGHEVRLVRPPVIFGRLCVGNTGLAKWIGYIDRFLIYPILLRSEVSWADVIHICDQANAVYVRHLRRRAHILTCHDMLAVRAALGEIAERPTSWTGLVYQRWILGNLRRTQLVACVSDQTRQELLRVAQLPKDRVTVIPNALNYDYQPMHKQEAATIAVKELGLDPQAPFFIHVGGNEWYKNRVGVLHLFSSLSRRPRFQHYRLVMVGKPLNAEMRSLVTDLGLSRHVHELISVSNEHLRALYSLAQALLFPSLQEGFGWPIVEAQACGCLVITTQLPPMTDVSGGAAIFIDPAETECAADQIEASWERHSQLVRGGLANASKFRLGEMINQYATNYHLARAETLALESR